MSEPKPFMVTVYRHHGSCPRDFAGDDELNPCRCPKYWPRKSMEAL